MSKVLIVDDNKLQLWGWTEELCGDQRKVMVSMPDPGGKFAAFGWATLEIDGHDTSAILEACEEAKTIKGQPSVIIANTVKGKGVSFMEDRCAWHGRAPNADELSRALLELGATSTGRNE